MSPVKAGRDLCLVLPVLSALGCKQLIPRAPRPGPWAPWTRPQAALPTTCLCLQSPTWEPHPRPINSCIWMDTQRCDLPRLRTDHIFIQASWQHTNHSAKLRHLGQVPGRNLESDPHYPLMGSVGSKSTQEQSVSMIHLESLFSVQLVHFTISELWAYMQCAVSI